MNVKNQASVESARPSKRKLPTRIATFVLLMLAVPGIATLTACEERSAMDEAIEEVQDEVKDAKKAVKDEIDDHS